MQATKIKFSIATPERVVYESEVDSVTCPTEMGEITILPNHIPLVATLAPGELKVVEDSDEKYMAVAGGFLEVRSGHEIVVLADAAEREEEIDLARAEEAREKARQKMREEARDESAFVEGLAAIELNDKWGYIDKTGKMVIEPKYYYAGVFVHGLADVDLNATTRYCINTKGEIVKEEYCER